MTVAIALLVLVILYWVLPTIFLNMLPAAVKSVYSTWGTTLPLIIAIALLCIIHIDNNPIATFRDMTSTSTITILVFIGTVTVLENCYRAYQQ